MIGKPEWFTYRTFGWGISPKTWQGWVYVCVLALLVGLITTIGLNDQTKLWLFIAIMAIVFIDIIHIMTRLGKVHDERENHQQLIIERNCSFAAIAGLLVMALYEAYKNKALLVTGAMPFDISIIVVLGLMFVTKIGSTIYLKVRM